MGKRRVGGGLVALLSASFLFPDKARPSRPCGGATLPGPERLATMPLPAAKSPEGGSVSIKVSMKVNGKAVSAEVEERTLLVAYIRESLRLTGTHVSCDTAQCGACTVSMNGKAVK